MIPTNALEALATLVEYAFVGRILLSLLPPGLPGLHSPRDLPATWAASHLLGTLSLTLELHLLERLHLPHQHLVLLAPWAILALLRWITLPGAMVPRHEPAHEDSGPIATLLLFASALAVLSSPLLRVVAAANPSSAFDPAAHASSTLDPSTPLRVADSLALLALVSYGLSAARRAPLGRAVAVLALAAVLSAAIARSFTHPIPLALTLGGGAALAIPWLRRGDRRAAALAVLALSGSALLGPRDAIFAAVSLFALWVHTPQPSRPNLAILSAALFAACAILGFQPTRGSLPLASVLPPLAAVTLLMFGFALLARRRWIAARGEDRPGRDQTAHPIDSSRPQAALLRDIVLLSIVAMASRDEFTSLDGLVSGMLPLAPLLAIEASLLLAPAETPLVSSAAPDAASGSARR